MAESDSTAPPPATTARRRLRRLLPLAVLVLLVLAAAGYWQQQRRRAELPQARYQFQPVARGALAQTVSANGTLNPVTLVNVGTQVSGTVKKLSADFNDHVGKGQVLLELDPALLEAQARQSAAAVKNAAAALELARQNEARNRGLYAQHFISPQAFDTAVQARKAAESQSELAQAQLAKDRVNLGYTVIRSPVSGVVVNRAVDVGQTVAASFQTPTLFLIAQDLANMQIDTSFGEADIASIRVGQAARFTVDAFAGRQFDASVRQLRLNPTTQQNVVTYDVVIAVANPEQILLPGMTAYVNIVVARRSDALLVPNAALRYQPAGTLARAPARTPGLRADRAGGTVYVLSGDAVRPVRLALGISDGRQTEVLGGAVRPGDQLVVADTQPSAGEQSGSTVRFRMF